MVSVGGLKGGWGGDGLSTGILVAVFPALSVYIYTTPACSEPPSSHRSWGENFGACPKRIPAFLSEPHVSLTDGIPTDCHVGASSWHWCYGLGSPAGG